MSYIAIYIYCGSCYLHSQESSIQLFHWIYSVDPNRNLTRFPVNESSFEVNNEDCHKLFIFSCFKLFIFSFTEYIHKMQFGIYQKGKKLKYA